MRRWLLFASALLIATAAAGGNALAATSPSLPPTAGVTAKASPHVVAGHERGLPGTKQILRLAPGSAGPQVRAHAQAAQPLVTTPTAKINVTYIGFSTQAKTAFQAAVNIWQTQIHSTVPIDVVADWSNLTRQYGDSRILGAAGPTSFAENFANAPVQNVYYPIALANAIAGSDQAPANVCNSDPSLPDASGAEISASFNSLPGAPWYYGTTGTPGPTQVDLESVVLHELGHGLGFVGSYDGLDPTTGQDSGKGYYGLSGDGTDPTIFDSFVADGSYHTLESAYTSGTWELGNALRGAAAGLEWLGTAGDAAAGGFPILYSPDPYEEGSSFSHLDEADYPAGDPNALMTPALHPQEVEHSVGSIVLGMFQDMGWPQSGSPAPTAPIGDYHVAAPMRLASQSVKNSAPLHVHVAGVDGLPAASGLKAVAVTVTEQSPTRTGIWSTLADCGGAAWPDAQNFQSGQTRTTQSIVPVDESGNIEVSVTASPAAAMSATVSVDLVGWYGAGGVSFHPLTPKQAFAGTLTATPVDLKILGVAGVPTSGVTAVVVSAGEGFGVPQGFLYVGPGGVNSIVPAVSYSYAELTQNLVIVPLGTGAGAGKIRLRVNAGHALAVLNVVGWYGPSTAGGLNFHPAGPARLSGAPRGQDVLVGGMPPSTHMLLNIHLGSPTASATLSAAPGGGSVLVAVQEFRAQQNVSGRIVVATNAAGQVRLHVSSGVATFYTDVEGWFSP